MRGLLDSLQNAVEGLRAPAATPGWSAYDVESDHYAAGAARAKEEIVGTLIARVGPRTVWDLGSNVGRFSRLASSEGISSVAFDLDPGCVEANYRAALAEDDRYLLPLVLDLMDPSPAIGWANEERMSLLERGPADLALMLALIHHLAIGNNVPLPRIAKFLAQLCRWAVVEFVPKDDEKVSLLLLDRDDIFPDYTSDGFEASVVPWFEIDERVPIDGSTRVLYLLKRR